MYVYIYIYIHVYTHTYVSCYAFLAHVACMPPTQAHASPPERTYTYTYTYACTDTYTQPNLNTHAAFVWLNSEKFTSLLGDGPWVTRLIPNTVNTISWI